jgi:hypothetical protein
VTDARALIQALDGSPLQKQGAGWEGFFEGEITVSSLEERSDMVRFDMLLPTHTSDIGDFIWRSEQEAGSTEKVALTQGAEKVHDARVVHIVREGKSESWVKADSERYRLTFEVLKTALRPGEPLEVHVSWNGVDVAVARGSAGAAAEVDR